MSTDWLLCDFHIHTTLSDGNLSLREIVDLYGKNGFDVICISDHVVDQQTRKVNDSWSIKPEDFKTYLRSLWKESQRAWNKYQLLLIPGIELTNEYEKYHILALDIKELIDPTLPIEIIVQQIHDQGALAILCHPHRRDTEGNQPYMHVWNNYKYANLFDAWEIGNRNDLFDVTDLREFNHTANSDFHTVADLYSWKTIIKAEKNVQAIKCAIKENQNVAIFLFRDNKIQLRKHLTQTFSKNSIVCEALASWP